MTVCFVFGRNNRSAGKAKKELREENEREITFHKWIHKGRIADTLKTQLFYEKVANVCRLSNKGADVPERRQACVPPNDKSVLLAMYDRFGRLMHGSEILAKDVLEYVVLEKHLSNEYGSWRLHDKILPAWLPVREPSARTHRRAASQRDVDVVHATQEEVKEVEGDKSGNV